MPEVLAVSDDAPNHLVLEWIVDGGPARTGDDEGERRFGAGLARLHAAGAACFGREDRRTTGSRGLPNDPAPTWAEFYAHASPRCRSLGSRATARALAAEHDRRASNGSRRTSPTSVASTSRRRACTVTSGPATGSSVPTVGTGWWIRPRTAVTASSISR